jgi:hypothetical protein
VAGEPIGGLPATQLVWGGLTGGPKKIKIKIFLKKLGWRFEPRATPNHPTNHRRAKKIKIKLKKKKKNWGGQPPQFFFLIFFYYF